ncbi:MAG: S41 family peptidase [Oscillospiraceae bacterium]|nr:S41 family peptidase [Oscillospiraceae bacterium]
MKRKKKKIVIFLSLVATVVLAVGGYLLIHSRYNGIYTADGYGLCLVAKNGSVKVFEITDDYYSAEPGLDGFLLIDTLWSGLGKMKLVQTDEGLQMIDVGAQVTYHLRRNESSFFEDRIEVKEGMPVEAFAMFYQIYDENYAFESLYGADISAKYEELRNQVTGDTTDAELFEKMKELVSDLRDGHVGLEWNDQFFCAADCEPEWIVDDEQLSLLSEVIINRYARDYKKFDDCMIRYGMLSDNAGLIIIHAMGTESLNKTKSTKKAMDQIITEFNAKGVKSVAIELRFNGGGLDEASLLLAGYFTDTSYPAYRKQAYYKGEYSSMQEMCVEPSNIRFDGDVYILTSGYTISAAETFLLSMLANPNERVTVVGERTAGFFSDAFDRSMPGDFYYSISNERYWSANGEAVEGLGIEPDIRVATSVEAAREGFDPVLDAVLRLIEEGE